MPAPAKSPSQPQRTTLPPPDQARAPNAGNDQPTAGAFEARVVTRPAGEGAARESGGVASRHVPVDREGPKPGKELKASPASTRKIEQLEEASGGDEAFLEQCKEATKTAKGIKRTFKSRVDDLEKLTLMWYVNKFSEDPEDKTLDQYLSVLAKTVRECKYMENRAERHILAMKDSLECLRGKLGNGDKRSADQAAEMRNELTSLETGVEKLSHAAASAKERMMAAYDFLPAMLRMAVGAQ